MRMSDWIVKPEAGMIETLANYGRFLREDYSMAIESMPVPEIFEEDLTPTGRKFVIVAGKESPIVLCRSLFLCLKLSGPESVAIKSNNMDDIFFINNVIQNHGKHTECKVFLPHVDSMSIHEDWLQAINEATDIVVFGDDHTISAFRDYETVERRVWEYEDKFSFGVVRSEHLNAMNINSICFDFVSFYGEGRLAPKFYFVIGELTDKLIKRFSENMIAIYCDYIEGYRNKLSFARRSDFATNYIDSNYPAYYVRVDKMDSRHMFDSLYGDIRLIQVSDYQHVESFIDKYKHNISTVAINLEDDWDMIDVVDDYMITRVCNFGDMQFPSFFEQYDPLDDFNIYVEIDEEEEYIEYNDQDDESEY